MLIVSAAADTQPSPSNASNWLPALIGALASAFVPFFIVIYQGRSSRKRESGAIEELKNLIDIQRQLPNDSNLHPPLNDHIERRIVRMNAQVAAVRDPLGLTLGSAFLILGSGLVYLVIKHGGYWYPWLILAAIMIILGATGLAGGFQREDGKSGRNARSQSDEAHAAPKGTSAATPIGPPDTTE
jgi:hypothetical protein